ncbi:sugar transferase [bacterium]|nr:sugar transferase [candidate division CSSED10-310 bacterium]
MTSRNDRSSPARGLPRWVDFLAAFFLLIGLSPVFLLCALAVRFSSKGPIFFSQQRVGRKGRLFRLIKFRSMRVQQRGPEITAGDDQRITRIGKILRGTKLDELPELINILKGDMAFVGPRPETPRFVDPSDVRWRRILERRPGLTDPVTIRLRNEEKLMAGITGDRETFYRNVLQPYKLEGYIRYHEQRTVRSDLWVIIKTLWVVVTPSSADLPALEHVDSERQSGRQGG